MNGVFNENIYLNELMASFIGDDFPATYFYLGRVIHFQVTHMSLSTYFGRFDLKRLHDKRCQPCRR